MTNNLPSRLKAATCGSELREWAREIARQTKRKVWDDAKRPKDQGGNLVGMPMHFNDDADAIADAIITALEADDG